MIYSQVRGVAEIRQRLAEARKAVPEAFDRYTLGFWMVQRIQKRYLRSVDERGVPWKALSPRTKKGPYPLVQTWNLYHSIDLLDTAPNGRYAINTGLGIRIGIRPHTYTKGKFTYNTGVYGRMHQTGVGRPKRRFLGIGPDDVRAVTERIRRTLKRKLS